MEPPNGWPDAVKYSNSLFVAKGPKIVRVNLPVDELESLEIFNVPSTHPAYIPPGRPGFPGRGVRAIRPIAAGARIGVYAGNYRPAGRGRDEDNYYLFDVRPQELDFVVDAAPIGNATRFFNDPRGSTNEPNMETEDISFSHQSVTVYSIAFHASRYIDVGEELLFNYEAPGSKNKYWDLDTPVVEVIDLCGCEIVSVKREKSGLPASFAKPAPILVMGDEELALVKQEKAPIEPQPIPVRKLKREVPEVVTLNYDIGFVFEDDIEDAEEHHPLDDFDNESSSKFLSEVWTVWKLAAKRFFRLQTRSFVPLYPIGHNGVVQTLQLIREVNRLSSDSVLVEFMDGQFLPQLSVYASIMTRSNCVVVSEDVSHISSVLTTDVKRHYRCSSTKGCFCHGMKNRLADSLNFQSIAEIEVDVELADVTHVFMAHFSPKFVPLFQRMQSLQCFVSFEHPENLPEGLKTRFSGATGRVIDVGLKGYKPRALYVYDMIVRRKTMSVARKAFSPSDSFNLKMIK